MMRVMKEQGKQIKEQQKEIQRLQGSSSSSKSTSSVSTAEMIKDQWTGNSKNSESSGTYISYKP